MRNRQNFSKLQFITLMAIVIIGTLSCSQPNNSIPETALKIKASNIETIIIDTININEMAIVPKIHFNNLGTSIVNKKITDTDPCVSFLDENDILLLKTTIDTVKKEIYAVYFGMGMSFDPHFSIFKNDNLIGEIEGVELSIPGNGIIYSNGHTNNLYSENKAWKLTANKLEEIEQPLQYVGLKTIALSNFTIYADTQLQSTVTTVSEGESIELLVEQNNFFLIRTSHNLVGWWKIDDPLKSKQIDNLYFLGD